jgi:hypothetical protein
LRSCDEDNDSIPKINYSIRCTDKGWGIELSELIRNCLLGFIWVNSSPINKSRKIILENFELVKYALIFLVLAIFSWWMSIRSDPKHEECQILASQVDQFIKTNIASDEKLNFIAKVVSFCSKTDPPSFLLTLMLFVAPMATMIFGPHLVYQLIKFPTYRFIIFTEQSKRRRDKYFQKINDQKTFWVVTIVVSLIVGILGNYIFTQLSHFFKGLHN